MGSLVVDVVVRCKNEVRFIAIALENLLRQDGVQPRVLVLDDDSTDGSREAAERLGVRVLSLESDTYIAAVVLNRGMRLTSSELVAFVDADAIAQRETALLELLSPFALDPRIAATFGRRTRRALAEPTSPDGDRTLVPAGTGYPWHGRVFSMAASAVRRSAWAVTPFDEQLDAGDAAWTTRLFEAGYETRYVPSAEFEHAPSYDAGDPRGRVRREPSGERRIERAGPAHSRRDDVERRRGGVGR